MSAKTSICRNKKKYFMANSNCILIEIQGLYMVELFKLIYNGPGIIPLIVRLRPFSLKVNKVRGAERIVEKVKNQIVTD